MHWRGARVAITSVGVVAWLLAALPVPVQAQTPFIPYFGKNRVHYDRFEWHIYKTDHFELFYYPSIEPHLERVAAYAESAYQHISSELKHDLPFRVPIILFKTQSEFQSQNIVGMELPEGVLAFAEPERNRMVLPIDEPPDQLYRLIVHELTHVFEFDIIPRGLVGANLPLWVDEGLANYMAGYWNVLDLMQVRDAALSDSVPRISQFEAQPLSGRLPYSLGHATFEFIETKWGKEGLRQFLFSLRKSVIGGGESAYEEALKTAPEDFDEQFDRYLKQRFYPFRDKERPADYGRNLSPNPRQNRNLTTVLSLDASPSGDMLAGIVGNRKDQELDIIILSAKTGEVIRNLTQGFDKDRGFEYISTSGGLRGNLVPWIAWAPVGDRIAYFVRTEKDKTLIVQNVIDRRIDYRIPLKSVDGPESPSFSPDGMTVAFSALRDGVSDIFVVNLTTGEIKNVTNDKYADYSPTFAPDGRSIVYSARISSNDKLFQLDLASGKKAQLTFGAHDDTSAKFADASTIVFTSTALPPTPPLPVEVARNAYMPNVWSLDLRANELKQWTDTVTGNISPVPLRTAGPLRVAFISYYKGENAINVVSTERPRATVASADFGTAGPILDFTPPMGHQLVPDNIHRKGRFERMTLANRPPINVGVTSSGNWLGSTELVFTDVLGDKMFGFSILSISQYRSFGASYVNIERRLQYSLQGFWQDQFYYGGAEYSQYAPLLDRDNAIATRTQRGAIASAIYPFNRYTRAELYGGYQYLRESYDNFNQDIANDDQIDFSGNPIFRDGNMLPLGVAIVQETTVFREYGPVAGNTFRIALDYSPGFGGSWLTRTTAQVDARHYTRLGTNGVFAVRFKGFRSWGTNPDFMYFGGNSEMRGYEYLQFYGQHAFFANAELRFPIIEAMLTPLGVLGGLRGVFFFDVGGSGFNGVDYTLMTNNTSEFRPLVGYELDAFGFVGAPIYGPPELVSGFRLVDGRASYGFGLESHILGFPIHLDWAWRSLFNSRWEDLYFRTCGPGPTGERLLCGPAGPQFRRAQFKFWIGYDF